jgi:hypothetical protein
VSFLKHPQQLREDRGFELGLTQSLELMSLATTQYSSIELSIKAGERKRSKTGRRCRAIRLKKMLSTQVVRTK